MVIGKLEFTPTVIAGEDFLEFDSACFSTSVSSRILDKSGMGLSNVAVIWLKCSCGGV